MTVEARVRSRRSAVRGGLSDRFRSAKAEAVSRFLRPAARTMAFSAFAVTTTDPQENVVGVGIGPKLVDGKLAAANSVRIYVERKLPKSVIPKSMLLPRSISGVPVDVVETGRFTKQPAAVPVEKTRLRPAQPGCSVGFARAAAPGFVMAGTFGALVRDATGTLYILSNNHVLADENALPLGSPIIQPGLLDGGNMNTDAIADLSQFVRLKKSGPNRLDAAIARLRSANLAKAEFLPQVGVLASGDPVAATDGMSVCKVGRTTGYTEGVITDLSADIRIRYGSGMLLFLDQLVIESAAPPFSASGDSGSLIVDRATARPVGLLFAGSGTHTLANPIADVLSTFGVIVVS